MKKRLLALLCLSLGVFIQSEELLHYDFQTRTADGKLQDLSGKGHHGGMQGGFAAATADGRQGLAFNGKDTCIIPTNESGLKVSGDLSLTVTFRVTPDQGQSVRRKSPLIFGSIDRGGRDRNYTLFFDYGTHLVVNVGDGATNSTHFIKNVNDGKLHTATVVIAYPQALLYLDGKLIERAQTTVTPNKAVGDYRIRLGAWRAGFFLGELYDLRVFNHALTEAEVLTIAGKAPSASLGCQMQLEVNGSDIRRCADWQLSIDNIPDDARAIQIQVKGAQEKNTYKLDKAQLERHRYFGTGTQSAQKLPFGKHTLVVSLLDGKGKELKSTSQTFDFQPLESPEKYNNMLGISEEVLPPWTPLEVKQCKESLEVAVWNRRYTFGNAPLSSTIFSGDSLSEAPSFLELNIDGKPAQFTSVPIQLLKSAKHQVVLKQAAQHPDMEISAVHTIDFDGFDRILVKLQARRELKLTGLRFHYPLKAKHVKTAFGHLNDARPLTGAKAFPFKPVLYVGDEDRGLSFLAESDEFWYPKQNAKAITVTPQAGQDTLFSLTPVATSLTMKAGETFTYEYALTATPIRPETKSCWDRRIIMLRPYCGEFDSIGTQHSNGKSLFQCYVEAGMRGLLVIRTEHAFSYPPIEGSDYTRKLKELVSVAQNSNVQVAPYAVGFLFSERAPEWKERNLYRVTPLMDFSVKGDFLERETGHKQHTYTTCTGKPFQDLMLYRVREAVKNTGMNGLYLDGTADSYACNNPIHGCGYVDRDGKTHCTYNSFRCRELIRRLYTLLYQMKGQEAFLELHYSIAFNAPAAAWATSLLSGEQIKPAPHAYLSLPPECMRFAYTGRNIGTGVDFLCYTGRNSYRSNCALAFVHNIPVRPSGLDGTAELNKVWQIRDRFSLDRAEFIGYWEKDVPVKAREPGVYVSCYKRDNKSLVLVIANLTDKKQTVTLTGEGSHKLPAPFELGSEDFTFIVLNP